MTHSSAWAFKNFRLFTYGSILLAFAAQTQSLLIGWQVYEIKRDPLYLGFIGLAEALPALGLTLIAGYIVDRGQPLKIYKVVLWLNLLTAALLLAISNPWAPLLADKKIAALYCAAFFSGLVRGFRMPTRTAMVPLLVPRYALHASSAWTSTAFAVASAAGPALGGLMYAWQGAMLPYAVNFVAVAATLALTAAIKIPPRASVPRGAKAVEELTAGLRYVFKHGLLLPALALDMFAVLFGGAVALLPVFAGEILKVGPVGLGILRSAPAVGALVGSLVMVRFPIHRGAGRVLFASVGAFGLCMMVFGLSTSFWLSVCCLAVGGVFDSVSMILRGTIVQLSAPPEMRGRVGAVNSLFINISNQLGEFESGVAAKLLGTARSVVLGGAVTLVVVAGIALRSPRLRRMNLDEL